MMSRTSTACSLIVQAVGLLDAERELPEDTYEAIPQLLIDSVLDG